MPFTLSHPLAAMVLRRTGLPMAGMVAGTIAPDLPMFLPGRGGYSFTHSVLGIVTVDLLTSVVGVAAWVFLIRSALVDSAPAFIRERLAAAAYYSARQWALVPVAAVVGASTHVGWDELTHAGRWGDQHVGWLHAEHGGWAGYHWAQAVSSVAGLVAVVVSASVTVLRRQRRARVARVTELVGRAPCAIVTVAAVGCAVAGLSHLGAGVHAAAFVGAVVGTVALTGAVVAMSLAWQLLALRESAALQRSKGRSP